MSMRLCRPKMDGKVPSEIDCMSVHCVVLFPERHIFQELRRYDVQGTEPRNEPTCNRFQTAPCHPSSDGKGAWTFPQRGSQRSSSPFETLIRQPRPRDR